MIVLEALEGDFPSLSRPEPMFDLATLEGAIARSEVNRRRLADERSVQHRAGLAQPLHDGRILPGDETGAPQSPAR